MERVALRIFHDIPMSDGLQAVLVRGDLSGDLYLAIRPTLRDAYGEARRFCASQGYSNVAVEVHLAAAMEDEK